jgi:hypothetical protein
MQSGRPRSCSAIVKLSADSQHLWTSHNTWTGYFTMLRLSKTYRLPLRGAAATTSLFSGYYGTLSSLDDFFVLSSGLVVQAPSVAPVARHEGPFR